MNVKIRMITAMLIFGSVGIFVRNIHMPSSIVALVRGIIGTLFLLLVCLVMRKRISLKAIRKNLKFLIFSGAAIGIHWICLFEAYQYTTIAIATLCYYLAPVFVILASPLLLKEKLTPAKIGCVALSLFGMILVVGVFGTENQSGSGVKGIVLGLIAALLYATVVILNKYLKEIESVETTVSQLSVASLILLPYVMLTVDVQTLTFDRNTIFLLLFVGIVNTGFAYWLYFSSLAELSGQTAAIFSYIDPVTAIVLSAILLHERMSALQIIGAVFILGATFISEIAGKQNTVKNHA